MQQKIIPISKAKALLAEVVRDSDDHDVVLLKHGRPAAVVMSSARHDALIDNLIDKLVVELGLNEDG